MNKQSGQGIIEYAIVIGIMLVFFIWLGSILFPIASRMWDDMITQAPKTTEARPISTGTIPRSIPEGMIYVYNVPEGYQLISHRSPYHSTSSIMLCIDPYERYVDCTDLITVQLQPLHPEGQADE